MTEQYTIEIPGVAVHKSCVCYQKGSGQTIRMVDFDVENGAESLHLTFHNIIYVLQGCLNIVTHNTEISFTLDKNEFAFLPTGTVMEYSASEPGAMLLIRLKNVAGKIPECNTFRLQRSGPLAPPSNGIHKLKANERIEHLIDGLVQTERDGLKCGSYAGLVIGQLIYLIHVYYTQDEYSRFYSTALSPDVAFSDFVMENCKKYLTAKEMANALCMTPQQFTLRFIKIFGTTPGSYLQTRKAEYVYYDLCSSSKPLKSIAKEYGYSMPNFVRFCHSSFGSSPGDIREKLNHSSGGSE